MTDDRTLLDAVDDLTLDRIESFDQTTDQREFIRKHNVRHDPLLDQLESAISASMGNDGGSKAAAARERALIDGDALYRFVQISSEIHDWCRMRKLEFRRTDRLADLLRRWYTATLSGEQIAEDFYIRRCASWKALIETKLDPPRRREVTEPCPVCEASTWTDEDGQKLPHPILVTNRDEAHDTTAATCRACQASWRGITELRALRWEIDQKEAARLAATWEITNM